MCWRLIPLLLAFAYLSKKVLHPLVCCLSGGLSLLHLQYGLLHTRRYLVNAGNRLVQLILSDVHLRLPLLLVVRNLLRQTIYFKSPILLKLILSIADFRKFLRPLIDVSKRLEYAETMRLSQLHCCINLRHQLGKVVRTSVNVLHLGSRLSINDSSLLAQVVYNVLDDAVCGKPLL